MRRPRETVLSAAERLSTRLTRAAAASTLAMSGTDLAVSAALARSGLDGLNDPAAYVQFLRSCWGPDVAVVKSESLRDNPDEASHRFDTLIAHLASGIAAIPVDDAQRIGRISDDLLASREPFDRPTYSTDVGLHATISSSFGHSGRLLTAVVRHMRRSRCLEIGTAYGMSSLFLAAALSRGRDDGHVTTVECSHPQVDVAFPMLAREHPETVSTFAGRSEDVLPQVFADHPDFDLFFHDAEHSGTAYVADFTAVEPHLGTGSVVLFDDIHWDEPAAPPARTFEGWLEIAGHPRVRRAVEIDGRYGLLLLR